MYLEHLEVLISLLKKVDPLAQEWARYFEVSKELYLLGNFNDSYKHTLGASGGMGSFDDDYWSSSLSVSDQKIHEYLKCELRKTAELNLGKE